MVSDAEAFAGWRGRFALQVFHPTKLKADSNEKHARGQVKLNWRLVYVRIDE